MQIQVINELNEIPDRAHIALDTCVFFDAYKNPDKFKDFFEYLKSKNSTLVTTQLHYLEFTRGYDTVADFTNADEFFNQTIDYLYPLKKLEDKVDMAKRIYRRDGKNVDIADFFMAALILEHREKVIVMSKNHKHFLTDLFDVKAFVPLLRKNDIQTYCFYQFSEEKYIKRLEDLEKTIKVQ